MREPNDEPLSRYSDGANNPMGLMERIRIDVGSAPRGGQGYLFEGLLRRGGDPADESDRRRCLLVGPEELQVDVPLDLVRR